jgi:hypothetical protein
MNTAHHPGQVMSVTLDTNLFYDKAEEREGADDFDRMIDLARMGKLQLFFTATTDFEDRSGVAIRLILRLMREGILQEDRNAGTPRERMPGGPGLHPVNESTCEWLLRSIWPEDTWASASENKRNDIYHIAAHVANTRDVFLARDKEILNKKEILKSQFEVTAMSPKELLERLTSTSFP